MSCNYSNNKLEERLGKLEKKNNRLNLVVAVMGSVLCIILLTGAGNKTFHSDEIECRVLRADQILLIDNTLGIRHELDGSSWRIHNNYSSTSGSSDCIMAVRGTGKESYVSSEYGIHGFRMSAWDGKKKTYITRLGDTYPSGNGLGALEIFDGKGKAYFSAVNGKVVKEELPSSEVKENAAMHKREADKLRAAVKKALNSPQKEMSGIHRNEKYGFTIWLPLGWTIKEGIAAGTIVNAVHRDESGKVAMITVNTQKLAEGEYHSMRNSSPEEIFESVKRQFTAQGITMTLLDSGVSSLNGEDAIWHKCRIMSEVMDKVWLTYNIPREENLFIVTGSADPEMYPEVESILKESITSVRFDTSYQGLNLDIPTRGDSWLMSILKGYGEVFLLVLATTGGIAILKYIIGRSNQQKQDCDSRKKANANS